MGQIAGVHMHATEFGASVQGRDRLAAIEQPVWIEGVLDQMKLPEFGGRELHAHLVDLLDTDAMFAGDGAAYLHAQFENPVAEFLRAFELSWAIGIVKDERMQVAIAGVKHVGNGKSVLP